MITQIQLCFTCRYIQEKYALLPFIFLKTMMMLSLTMICPYACLSYACTYLRRKGTPRHTGNWERRHSKKGECAHTCWCVCMCMYKCTHTTKKVSAVMHEWETDYYIDIDTHILQLIPFCGFVNGLFPILTPTMPREFLHACIDLKHTTRLAAWTS